MLEDTHVKQLQQSTAAARPSPHAAGAGRVSGGRFPEDHANRSTNSRVSIEPVPGDPMDLDQGTVAFRPPSEDVTSVSRGQIVTNEQAGERAGPVYIYYTFNQQRTTYRNNVDNLKNLNLGNTHSTHIEAAGGAEAFGPRPDLPELPEEEGMRRQALPRQRHSRRERMHGNHDDEGDASE